jgi:hypothetical protein
VRGRACQIVTLFVINRDKQHVWGPRKNVSPRCVYVDDLSRANSVCIGYCEGAINK